MNIRPEDCSREELEWYIKEDYQYDEVHFRASILAYRYGQAMDAWEREEREAEKALRICPRLLKPYPDKGAHTIPSKVFRKIIKALEDYSRHRETADRHWAEKEAIEKEMQDICSCRI